MNVTTTCPGPGTFLFVSVTIFTIPAIPNAADPPFFFSGDADIDVPADLQCRRRLHDPGQLHLRQGTAPSAELVLAVTPTPPTDTGAPPTDTGAPPTDTGAADERTDIADDRSGVADECSERHD